MPDARQGGRVLDIDDLDKATGDIAEALESISAAIKKLVGGKLKEEAIIILIRESLPRGSKLAKEDIKAVIDATKGLGDKYTRKT